jgi:hypothetical protein
MSQRSQDHEAEFIGALGIRDLDTFRVRRRLLFGSAIAFMRDGGIRRFSATVRRGTVLRATEPRHDRGSCWFVVDDTGVAAALVPVEIATEAGYLGFGLALGVEEIRRWLTPVAPPANGTVR